MPKNLSTKLAILASAAGMLGGLAQPAMAATVPIITVPETNGSAIDDLIVVTEVDPVAGTFKYLRGTNENNDYIGTVEVYFVDPAKKTVAEADAGLAAANGTQPSWATHVLYSYAGVRGKDQIGTTRNADMSIYTDVMKNNTLNTLYVSAGIWHGDALLYYYNFKIDYNDCANSEDFREHSVCVPQEKMDGGIEYVVYTAPEFLEEEIEPSEELEEETSGGSEEVSEDETADETTPENENEAKGGEELPADEIVGVPNTGFVQKESVAVAQNGFLGVFAAATAVILTVWRRFVRK